VYDVNVDTATKTAPPLLHRKAQRQLDLSPPVRKIEDDSAGYAYAVTATEVVVPGLEPLLPLEDQSRGPLSLEFYRYETARYDARY
jgi:hypothetical protein